MENRKYQALAHRTGCIRKKYRLTPFEAACCALWLSGAEEEKIPALAGEMDKLRKERWEGNAK